MGKLYTKKLQHGSLRITSKCCNKYLKYLENSFKLNNGKNFLNEKKKSTIQIETECQNKNILQVLSAWILEKFSDRNQ